jgi:hypothetical protein
MITSIVRPARIAPHSHQRANLLARLSPYTYAADALDGILSGRGGFLDEAAILAGITVATLVIGITGMRWREV